MGIPKTFICVLYLLLYSSFSSAQVSPKQLTQAEKGLTTCKELLRGLDELAKAVTKTKEITGSVQKVLKVFDGFLKLVASLNFFGALISFIFAFIPQSNPMLVFMKEQFAEVNRKLDSLSLQIQTLQMKMEWTDYASVYSKDENNIRNSWAKLKEFIENAPVAKTEMEKTRLAERFTTFYENTATEGSVANFYKYLTESHGASLNKNLLQLVTNKAGGDFRVLTQYSSYFTALMVSGLQLNLFYYKLKGYDAAAKAKLAETELANTLSAIQDALIKCADDFETWAGKDIIKIGTQPYSDNKKLATNIKEHLDQKFSWYDWTVIAHPKDVKNEYTSGNSISFHVQDKTIIHVIHQEKGYSADSLIKDQIKAKWHDVSKDLRCERMKDEVSHVFGVRIMNHIQFLHAITKSDDYAQTKEPDVELTCNAAIGFKYRVFILFLKNKDVVDNPPCPKLNCLNGECRQIKDTTRGFCKCQKMFHGPTCEKSIQNEIDYAAIEDQIDSFIYQPVPDLTAIFFSVKDLKQYTKELIDSVRDDVQWTQVYVKYNNVITKFRYITKFHTLLENGTVTQNKYVSEVGAQFSGENTFSYMLTQFDDMMKGTGFQDKMNILEVYRQSLLRSQMHECTQAYTEKIDNFVRYMFALEKEAVLAWMKYLTVTGKLSESALVTYLYKTLVAEQWRLFNNNGCGSLLAHKLLNDYCLKPYHSTDKQHIRIRCSEGYEAFPETVQCSKGKWISLPVCYKEAEHGVVQCSITDGGSTKCIVNCLPGWTDYLFLDYRESFNFYYCIEQPCPAFEPVGCKRCTEDHVCQDHETCKNDKCRDLCTLQPCGVNAQCSSSFHVRHCSCISPWKGDPIEGCNSQDLQWITAEEHQPNAVKSPSHRTVCRALGPDGGFETGWVSEEITGGFLFLIRYTGFSCTTAVHRCHYEYHWKEYRTESYEVLVDPCGGNGVQWVKGTHNDMVQFAVSKRWDGLPLYVCSSKVVGTLFNTRHGFLCHIAYGGEGTRSDDFYSLVKKPCV